MLLFEAFQLVTYDGVRLHSEMWTRDDLLEPSGTQGSHSSVSGLKSVLAIAIRQKMNRQLLILVPSLLARCVSFSVVGCTQLLTSTPFVRCRPQGNDGRNVPQTCDQH